MTTIQKSRQKKGSNLHKSDFKIERISIRSTVSQNTLFANMRLKVIQFRIELTIVKMQNIVIEIQLNILSVDVDRICVLLHFLNR